MEIVPRLEKRTHYIATFANVITLVGLLGTIIGLIKGFTAVAAGQPGREGRAAVGLDLDRDEQHRLRADGGDPVPADPRLPAGRTSEIVDGLEAAKISFLNLVQRLKAEQRRRAPSADAT